MKVIQGSWKKPNGEPVSDQAILWLGLSQEAKERRTGEKVERITTIELEEDGSIPPGTAILASDELSPAGTFYEVVVMNRFDTYFTGCLKIVGESPINLNALTPEPVEPAPVPDEPEPEPVSVVPPLPARRIRGAKYSGFVAGDVYGTAISTGATKVKCGGKHSGSFYLPFKVVTRQALIFVDIPQQGSSILVELHSIDDAKRVCSTTIDASKRGYAGTYFDETVVLNPGEYSFNWSLNSVSSEPSLRSIGGDVPQIHFSI